MEGLDSVEHPTAKRYLILACTARQLDFLHVLRAVRAPDIVLVLPGPHGGLVLRHATDVPSLSAAEMGLLHIEQIHRPALAIDGDRDLAPAGGFGMLDGLHHISVVTAPRAVGQLPSPCGRWAMCDLLSKSTVKKLPKMNQREGLCSRATTTPNCWLGKQGQIAQQSNDSCGCMGAVKLRGGDSVARTSIHMGYTHSKWDTHGIHTSGAWDTHLGYSWIQQLHFFGYTPSPPASLTPPIELPFLKLLVANFRTQNQSSVCKFAHVCPDLESSESTRLPQSSWGCKPPKGRQTKSPGAKSCTLGPQIMLDQAFP